MTRIHLRYVDRFIDRHGHTRHYFRRPGGRRIPLPGLPGSDEFMAAYRTALAGEDAPATKPKVRGEPGTFSRLTAQYFVSPEFLRLRTRTQYAYRLVIERFLAEHGHRRVVEMRRDDVKKIMALKSATPGAANDLLKKIRTLIKFAIDAGWRTDDPTLRIKTFPEHEFHTWTEDEIAQYEERWPIGSRERTAFALHLYTGQRRSDVARMAWTDVAENAFNVVQAKTGVRLTIPLHPNLSAALRAWPRKHVAMLTTAFNKPFTYAGYGNMMADAIAAAGLPDRCVLHGLRKAAARRLAEAGCSEKEIAAVTGHTTLKEVARYTRAADQKGLAAGAIAKLVEQKPDKNSQPSKSGLGKTEKR
jgi:enterobacteria phage integrase